LDLFGSGFRALTLQLLEIPPTNRRRTSLFSTYCPANRAPDHALRNILRKSYARFALFYRGLDHLLKRESLDYLKVTLDEFYTSFLAEIDFTSLDLCSAVNGIDMKANSRRIIYEFKAIYFPNCP
jgi:hypothetical protein